MAVTFAPEWLFYFCGAFLYKCHFRRWVREGCSSHATTRSVVGLLFTPSDNDWPLKWKKKTINESNLREIFRLVLLFNHAISNNTTFIPLFRHCRMCTTTNRSPVSFFWSNLQSIHVLSIISRFNRWQVGMIWIIRLGNIPSGNTSI